ncbi:MAG: hypothetical protein PHN88_04085 [Ignavibacteria bacterium]|nr:hypothetical protein [Ignavibacteria bacterium]
MKSNGLSPLGACKSGVDRIVKINRDKSKGIQAGFIVINKSGEYGAYANQRDFEYAVYSETETNILKKSKSVF